jgi:hypothetical protein
MRMHVPRTAVVSVPAYGLNVHGEREVIVAGTAWVNWDAWYQKAPSHDIVPHERVAPLQREAEQRLAGQ